MLRGVPTGETQTGIRRVITQPPAMGQDAPPDVFPIRRPAADDSFNRLIVRYSPIKRLATGFLWAEGPAWSGGMYPVQRCAAYQYRSGADPSSVPQAVVQRNGNCLISGPRQLSCRYFRRVVRWDWMADDSDADKCGRR